MESTVPPPPWRKYYDPLYCVTTDCVLEWPDDLNCNEFPVICPVHGILSQFCTKPVNPLCPCSDYFKNARTPVQESASLPGRPVSVREALERIWGGEGIEGLFGGESSGGAADSQENRYAAFMGEQLSKTPRGPVIVNSHSVRAITNKRKPHIDVSQIKLGNAYSYLQDLDLFKEWCAIFMSQIRHSVPKDVSVTDPAVLVTIYRSQNKDGLMINIFPGGKCFITDINYDHFQLRPAINFGDQVLEFRHCMLMASNDEPFHPSLHDHDVFNLRIRPCPFLQSLTLSMGPCPTIREECYSRHSKRFSLRPQRDLGFILHKGCITAVADNSPAQLAGLQPDHCIINVDRRFVANHSDKDVVSLIRQAVNRYSSRSVQLDVMPKRIYQHLKSVDNMHYVIVNQGFHLDTWLNSEALGLSRIFRPACGIVPLPMVVRLSWEENLVLPYRRQSCLRHHKPALINEIK